MWPTASTVKANVPGSVRPQPWCVKFPWGRPRALPGVGLSGVGGKSLIIASKARLERVPANPDQVLSLVEKPEKAVLGLLDQVASHRGPRLWGPAAVTPCAD